MDRRGGFKHLRQAARVTTAVGIKYHGEAHRFAKYCEAKDLNVKAKLRLVEVTVSASPMRPKLLS